MQSAKSHPTNATESAPPKFVSHLENRLFPTRIFAFAQTLALRGILKAMSKRLAFLLAGLCALFGFVGARLAELYIQRLPNHAGYYLVAVADRISPSHLVPVVRPRHTVLVVIDGLRAAEASTMQSLKRLRQAGQCRLTSVGPMSVSRPVYAVLSTGLEQDRTGVRNNDETSPLSAESIWQVAEQAGLRVTAVSELPWFRELFPSGFYNYQIVKRAADHFTTAESELGDLALIHPVYVDEIGHDYGGRSPEYAAAVTRADEELGRLLNRLDLGRDLVVVTSDHGHTDRGGHGAGGNQVQPVLTCFGGHGIRVTSERKAELQEQQAAALFDSRTIAPALAVLLQLRFPQNMRAGEDSLDDIWDLIDPRIYSADYLADRHAAVQRFRQINRAAVGRWLRRTGTSQNFGNWSELYTRASYHQLARGTFFLSVSLFLFLFLRRRVFFLRSFFFFFWGLATVGIYTLFYTMARGSFDFNSMNARSEFITWASAAAVFAETVALGLHYFRFRDSVALAIDQIQVVVVVLLFNVAHIVAFGWPLGFPLPGPILLFLPFIGNAFLAWASGFGCLLFLRLALHIPMQSQQVPG